MGQEARTAVEIRDFRGMSSILDPHDLPPGVSRVQVNVTATRMGELNVRRGLREVNYDAEDS